MARGIDVFSKYKVSRKDSYRYEDSPSAEEVIKALRFKHRTLAGVGLLIVAGFVVLFFVVPAVFWELLVGFGIIVGLALILGGGYLFLNAAYDHSEVLNKAKNYGVKDE